MPGGVVEQAVAAHPPDRPSRARRVVGIALRLLVAVLLYRLYALARNLHGEREDRAAYERAVDHARAVSGWSRHLPIPSERRLQESFLDHEWLIRAAGAFYGSAHFLVTLAAVLYLVVRRSRDVDRLLLTLSASTFLGVLCFALYPVAPPRLMPDGSRTVDTLAEVGGVWDYDHGVLERISDPFAAMPSLHMVWAVWVGLVLCGARRRWVRVAGTVYPCLTLASVLLTGNHWYEDAVAGVALTLVVHGLVELGRSRLAPRRARGGPASRPAPDPADPVVASEPVVAADAAR